jgi:Holliday junction resolvasome RuvABC ATP-dependent DNA helicase subunit
MFDSIIGQDALKRQLTRFITISKLQSQRLPHFVLSSGTGGTGKTTFVRAISEEVGRNLYTVSATDATQLSLFEKIKESDKNSIIFLEEWNAVNNRVDYFLRPLLENNLVLFRGIEYLNNNDNTICIATNNINVLSQPLLSRMEVFHMEDYSNNELLMIARQKSKDNLQDEILKEIVYRSRGIPRNISKLSRNIINEKIISNYIDIDKAITVMEDSGFFLKGLNRLDIKILNLLNNNGSLSLSSICAATGESEATVRQHETFLITNGYMTITTRRNITEIGRLIITML